MLLECCCYGGFTGGGEAGEPDCAAALFAERGALVAREAGVPCDVTTIGSFVRNSEGLKGKYFWVVGSSRGHCGIVRVLRAGCLYTSRSLCTDSRLAGRCTEFNIFSTPLALRTKLRCDMSACVGLDLQGSCTEFGPAAVRPIVKINTSSIEGTAQRHGRLQPDESDVCI